jgi:hypothetical protein
MVTANSALPGPSLTPHCDSAPLLQEYEEEILPNALLQEHVLSLFLITTW